MNKGACVGVSGRREGKRKRSAENEDAWRHKLSYKCKGTSLTYVAKIFDEMK